MYALVSVNTRLSQRTYYYYYYYAAFNAPCVGHKDDESQAGQIEGRDKFSGTTLRFCLNQGNTFNA